MVMIHSLRLLVVSVANMRRNVINIFECDANVCSGVRIERQDEQKEPPLPGVKGMTRLFECPCVRGEPCRKGEQCGVVA